MTTPQTRRLSTPEFVALMAMLMATIAFSIDAILPGLPAIAAELSPNAPNQAQLVVTAFVVGMGVATLVTGPMSDRFGRKPVVVCSALVYCAGALIAWAAQSLEVLLLGRLVQGLGAAGPRVVVMAFTRDLYSGREMARIMSFAMLIFSLVPGLAPSLGHVIIGNFGWRAVFLSFLIFSVLSVSWMWLRQPETLAPEARRPISAGSMWRAIKEMVALPTVRLSTLVQTLVLGVLFAMISSTQQIFDKTYGQGENFHLWFGGMAILAASASVINARLVTRLGMRAIIKATMLIQVVLSSLMALIVLLHFPNAVELWFYAFWNLTLFMMVGMTLGNLTTLAMEPVGHIAGLAASVISASSTVGAVVIAVPIGLAFNGTPLPLALGSIICSALSIWLTSKIRRDSD